ncbi:MAG: ferritin family protein [Candidatus Eremiobacteraeota bacterium]|nr:ferritin family protein [Candidatus Eremiobacteraeota bacterium]
MEGKFSVIAVISILFAATLAISPLFCADIDSKTLANIQEAYHKELNERASYLAFARKADQEGYTQVASLFRAAARSEERHARNFTELIRGIMENPNFEPQADIRKPDVKSTRENLEAALKGESSERDTIYPDFTRQAREENRIYSARAFEVTIRAETEHARLFSEALKNMKAWKGGKKNFLVCSVCGYTTPDMTIKKCPVCSVPRNKIETVN